MDEEEPTTQSLIAQQHDREHAEREHVEDASSEPEERAARRRADKAAYLKDKLVEQAEHPDDPA